MGDMIAVIYSGRFWRLFKLALSTLTLTVLTIGIYRFWMRSRLRRYYWASIQPGGVPLEYTGTGVEKLLGFLFAAVCLAIYLVVFNFLLSFVGLAYFDGNPLASLIMLVVLLPLIFYAQYRARRYVLSRTRWRGLRFGADAAAVAYMWRALGHTLLTVVSLGLLFPRQHFHLEKFLSDRTWYGDVKLHQNGTWMMLFRPWLAVLGAVIIFVGMFLLALSSGEAATVIYIVAAMPLLFISWVYYSTTAFQILTDNKQAGQFVTFQSKVRTGRFLRIYLLGGLLVTLIMVAIVVLLMLFGAVFFSLLGADPSQSLDISDQVFNSVSSAAGILFAVLAYALLMVFVGASTEVLIKQPIIAHMFETLTIQNLAEIESANQRAHDAAAEAGGFADALDVGAAI